MMYRFENESKSKQHILTLSGIVAEKGLFGESINSKDIKDTLDGVTKDIVIRLNSGGGDVFQGIEIYNYLKAHKSHVTVEITALAASAASLIAAAADNVIIRTGASFMLHEAATFTFGNKSDHTKSLNALSTIDEGIVDIYAERTGIDKKELAGMIADETWLSADKAVAKGFADEKSKKKAEEEPSKDNQKGGEKQVDAKSERLAKVIAQFLNEEDPDDKGENDDEKTIVERLDNIDSKLTDLSTRVTKLEDKDDDKKKDDDDKDKERSPQNLGYGRFLH